MSERVDEIREQKFLAMTTDGAWFSAAILGVLGALVPSLVLCAYFRQVHYHPHD